MQESQVKDILNNYNLLKSKLFTIACEIARIRKVSEPDEYADLEIEEDKDLADKWGGEVSFHWDDSFRYGYESIWINFPLSYLWITNYLEIEEKEIKEKEKQKAEQQLKEKEQREKDKKESDYQLYQKLKEKFENVTNS